MATAVAQWARLKEDLVCALRRGAWYKVIRLAPLEAVIDVKGKQVAVPRTALELAPAPPLRWTVVPSPKHAPRYPSTWGTQYGVCPNCRDRAQLVAHPASLRCTRCNGLFEVAWNESYLH
jgi:hypothetical protein